jgi:putative peptidoglycan lipid II flippase
VIIGAALFLGIQIPGLLRFRFRWTPRIDLRHPGVRKVITLLGPRVITMFFIQLVFLATDNIASRLSTGAVSALVYGWLIMQVPETLVGTAIGTALLPTLSEQIARGEREEFYRSLNRTLRVILAITLPGAALLGMAIGPLVDVFGFEVGKEMVVWTARAFLLGLAGHSLLEVAARAFYAQQNARTPLLAAVMMAAAFILLAVPFSRIWGPAGIALANTCAFTAEALFLLILLNRKSPGLLRVGDTLARAALVAAGGALLVFALLRLPFSGILLAMGGLAVGGLTTLPFIWPEVKLFIKIGE